MISVFSALVVLAVCSTVTSSRVEGVKRALFKKTSSCWKENSHDSPNKPEEADCLEACYMNKIGIMNESNQLVPGTVSDTLFDAESESKDGKTFKQISKDIEEKCKSVTDKDKCAAAVMIYACLSDENKELGFSDNEFW